MPMLNIHAIEPTVLFVRENDALLQQVRITVDNPSESAESTQILFEVGNRAPTTCPIGPVGKGEHTLPIHVPDLREPAPVTLSLQVGDQIHDRRELTWQPRKHWRVHLVPIAHHDLGYTDTIEGVLRKYCRIYEDVLRFCAETADWPEEARFRYTAEEAWSIQHFARNGSPEQVEKLARYVREGRIEVPALFGNQISGLCGHEELIRLLYPSFRLKRELGAPIRAGSITDVPGLSWGLPTALAGAGVRFFFAGLPTYFRWENPHVSPDIHTFWDEDAVMRSHGRPDAFYWEGPDGKQVLVYYQGGYGCWSPQSCREVLDQLPGMLDEMDERESPFSAVRYGGYGCGDNAAADIAASYVAREWNQRWAFPRLVVSTHSAFFAELEEECENLRTFRGELPHTDYAVGAVSTARETSLNRLTHDRLHAAEKAATLAFPSDPELSAQIGEAYENMLLFDEHTWGKARQVGLEQDFAWSEKAQYAYRAASTAEAILSRSLGKIAASVRLTGEEQHLIVFNVLSFARTDLVRVPDFYLEDAFDLVDAETGERISYQLVELAGPQAPVPHAAGRWARGLFNPPERFDLVFAAGDVPPMGYRTYRIAPRREKPCFSGDVEVGERTLENRFFRIGLDPHTGAVESVYDKELGRELVDPDASHRLNQLVVRRAQTGAQEIPETGTIARGEDGPVYGSLIVSGSAAGCPQLTQEIRLYDGIKRIDFANRVLKDSTPGMELYFAFPFKMDDPTFHFEASNSVIQPRRDQFPGSNSNYYSVQHWAEVADGEAGAVLSPVEAHLLEFGGLWPCYVSQAHHGVTPPDFGRDFAGPDELAKGHMYSFVMDSNFRTNFQPVQQGDLLFRYALTAHAGDWRTGRPRDFGWGVGNPLSAVLRVGPNEGTLPLSASFCQVDRDHVLVSALKRAEAGDGLIVRLIETTGAAAEVTVTLPFLEIERAYRTNLVEENQTLLPAREHSVAVLIEGFGIATIRLVPR